MGVMVQRPRRERVHGMCCSFLSLLPPPPLEESSHRLGGGEHLGLMLRGFACAPVAGGVLGSKPGARAGVRVPRELHGPVLPRGAEALIQAPQRCPARHEFGFLFRSWKVARK